MITVLADTQLSDRLREAQETVQVIDETGQTLGFFDPVAIAPPGASVERPPCTIEQLEELRKEKGGRALADILHDLEKRG